MKTRQEIQDAMKAEAILALQTYLKTGLQGFWQKAKDRLAAIDLDLQSNSETCCRIALEELTGQ